MTLLSDKTQESISVALLKQGDNGAFVRFVEIYQEMVFICCKTAGLRGHDIEDAASETFLAAYKSIGHYSGKSKLSSWLWKIAYHKAVDYRRKRGGIGTFSDGDIETFALPDINPPESALENREINNLIWHIVEQLPPAWAAAMVLHYREGKSTQEIGEIIDKPANTVKTYLHRGRSMLYSLLGTVWETYYAK